MLRESNDNLVAACADGAEAGEDTVAGALARAEAIALPAGLQPCAIRPAYERFHATLTEAQRAAFDDLVHQGRGR